MNRKNDSWTLWEIYKTSVLVWPIVMVLMFSLNFIFDKDITGVEKALEGINNNLLLLFTMWILISIPFVFFIDIGRRICCFHDKKEKEESEC